MEKQGENNMEEQPKNNIECNYTDNPIEQAGMAAADSIIDHLDKDERVLLLLTGGSGLAIANHICDQLKSIKKNNLYVSVTDERYGDVGHKDENWQQLLNNGFNLPGANLYRPLNGKSRNKATTDFSNWLTEQIYKADYKIALFGFGTDGHTAGVKPHTEAVDSPNFADSFTGEDFERITMTPKAISLLDEAIIQASGIAKIPVLSSLMNETIDIHDQPVQVLKSVPVVKLFTNNNI